MYDYWGKLLHMSEKFCNFASAMKGAPRERKEESGKRKEECGEWKVESGKKDLQITQITDYNYYATLERRGHALPAVRGRTLYESV